jgi:hypothetical protein
MKQQTPLRKAIAEIEADAKYKPIQYQLAINQAVSVLITLLPEERMVIEEAYDKGSYDMGNSEFGGIPEHLNGNHFFTSNFEQ